MFGMAVLVASGEEVLDAGGEAAVSSTQLGQGTAAEKDEAVGLVGVVGCWRP